MVNDYIVFILLGMIPITIGAFMSDVITGLLTLGTMLWIAALISYLNMHGRG